MRSVHADYFGPSNRELGLEMHPTGHRRVGEKRTCTRTHTVHTPINVSRNNGILSREGHGVNATYFRTLPEIVHGRS